MECSSIVGGVIKLADLFLVNEEGDVCLCRYLGDAVGNHVEDIYSAPGEVQSDGMWGIVEVDGSVVPCTIKRSVRVHAAGYIDAATVAT